MTKQQSKRGGVKAWGIMWRPSGMKTIPFEICEAHEEKLQALRRMKEARKTLHFIELKVIPVLITPIIKKAKRK